jgi:hypothetical protein
LAAQASFPGSGRRAPPNRITVEWMPRSASTISVFRSSSCNLTGRNSRRVRKSSSAKASRYVGERVCGVSGTLRAAWRSSSEWASGVHPDLSMGFMSLPRTLFRPAGAVPWRMIGLGAIDPHLTMK